MKSSRHHGVGDPEKLLLGRPSSDFQSGCAVVCLGSYYYTQDEGHVIVICDIDGQVVGERRADFDYNHVRVLTASHYVCLNKANHRPVS